MSTKEVDASHQDGPGWKIAGRFPTFEAAEAKRNEMLKEKDLQVKVHYQGPLDRKFFAVKTRLDPAKRPPSQPNRKKKRRK
jgi:hypothetical protein